MLRPIIISVILLSAILQVFAARPVRIKESNYIRSASLHFEGNDSIYIEQRRFYLDTGELLPAYPRFRSYLRRLVSNPVKQTVSDVDNPFLLGESEEERLAVHPAAGTIPDRMTVREIVPYISNEEMVEFLVTEFAADAIEGESGEISGYPVFLKTPADWCKEGILTLGAIIPSESYNDFLQLLMQRAYTMGVRPEGISFESMAEEFFAAPSVRPGLITKDFICFTLGLCNVEEPVDLTFSYAELEKVLRPQLLRLLRGCSDWTAYPTSFDGYTAPTMNDVRTDRHAEDLRLF